MAEEKKGKILLHRFSDAIDKFRKTQRTCKTLDENLKSCQDVERSYSGNSLEDKATTEAYLREIVDFDSLFETVAHLEQQLEVAIKAVEFRKNWRSTLNNLVNQYPDGIPEGVMARLNMLCEQMDKVEEETGIVPHKGTLLTESKESTSLDNTIDSEDSNDVPF